MPAYRRSPAMAGLGDLCLVVQSPKVAAICFTVPRCCCLWEHSGATSIPLLLSAPIGDAATTGRQPAACCTDPACAGDGSHPVTVVVPVRAPVAIAFMVASEFIGRCGSRAWLTRRRRDRGVAHVAVMGSHRAMAISHQALPRPVPRAAAVDPGVLPLQGSRPCSLVAFVDARVPEDGQHRSPVRLACRFAAGSMGGWSEPPLS